MHGIREQHGKVCWIVYVLFLPSVQHWPLLKESIGEQRDNCAGRFAGDQCQRSPLVTVSSHRPWIIGPLPRCWLCFFLGVMLLLHGSGLWWPVPTIPWNNGLFPSSLDHWSSTQNMVLFWVHVLSPWTWSLLTNSHLLVDVIVYPSFLDHWPCTKSIYLGPFQGSWTWSAGTNANGPLS